MISMGDIIECSVVSLSNKWMSKKKKTRFSSTFGQINEKQYFEIDLRNNT